MPALKKVHKRAARHAHAWVSQSDVQEHGSFRGKKTQTGNSLALRFDRALFKAHPEFSGEVEAHVIAPGRMLVVAAKKQVVNSKQEDPVIASFMSFLAAGMQQHPNRIQPLDTNLIERVGKLTRGMTNRPDESLGDEELL